MYFITKTGGPMHEILPQPSQPRLRPEGLLGRPSGRLFGCPVKLACYDFIFIDRELPQRSVREKSGRSS